MNVVIAIMNHAMAKATYYEPLSWLCNRFRAGLTTEALSIAAREYREQVDLFPQYVYYTDPPCRAEEFKKKHSRLFDKDKSLSLSVEEKNPPYFGSCPPPATAQAGSVVPSPQRRELSPTVIQATRQGGSIAVKTPTNLRGAQPSMLFLEPIVEGRSHQ
jgi:hypothetical protein